MTAQTDTLPPDAKGDVHYDASQVVVFGTQARRMLTDATDFTIDSPELYEAAADDLRRVKALAKQVEDTRVSITGPLDKAKKAVDALFKGPKDFLAQAETALKGAMLTWDTEQECIRREEQRRAEEARRIEAARLAEEQRQREEEARRRDEEARRLEEEARSAAAAGDAQKAQQLELAAAEEANKASDTACEAVALQQTADVISMPVAQPVAQKVSGISTSKTVDYEITDLHALVKHVAAHPELISLLAADSVKLRAQVRATGLHTNLPGVRVFEKKTLSARAA